MCKDPTFIICNHEFDKKIILHNNKKITQESQSLCVYAHAIPTSVFLVLSTILKNQVCHTGILPKTVEVAK